MRQRSIWMSFSDALEGIAIVVRSERNMRIHLLLGLLVVLLAAVLGASRLEVIALVFAIGMVFTAELFNTAVERMVDLIQPAYHPLAGTVKKIAAGGVLVTALAAAAVGYLVFIDYLLRLDQLLIRPVPEPYMIVLVLAAAATVAVGWRALRQGSRPSLHAAAAFALAAAIWEVSGGFAALAGLALAFLVAQSRVEGRLHSWWEVVTGALIGCSVALFFLRMIA